MEREARARRQVEVVCGEGEEQNQNMFVRGTPKIRTDVRVKLT